MEFINLTPHTITVLSLTGEENTFLPSGKVARIASTTLEVGDLNHPAFDYEKDQWVVLNGGNEPSFRLQRRVWGGVQGLPDPKPGVFLIVSALVLGHVKGRSDVVAPDTGPDAIRDDKGFIVAVRGFV